MFQSKIHNIQSSNNSLRFYVNNAVVISKFRNTYTDKDQKVFVSYSYILGLFASKELEEEYNGYISQLETQCNALSKKALSGVSSPFRSLAVADISRKAKYESAIKGLQTDFDTLSPKEQNQEDLDNKKFLAKEKHDKNVAREEGFYIMYAKSTSFSLFINHNTDEIDEASLKIGSIANFRLRTSTFTNEITKEVGYRVVMDKVQVLGDSNLERLEFKDEFKVEKPINPKTESVPAEKMQVIKDFEEEENRGEDAPF